MERNKAIDEMKERKRMNEEPVILSEASQLVTRPCFTSISFRTFRIADWNEESEWHPCWWWMKHRMYEVWKEEPVTAAFHSTQWMNEGRGNEASEIVRLNGSEAQQVISFKLNSIGDELNWIEIDAAKGMSSLIQP